MASPEPKGLRRSAARSTRRWPGVVFRPVAVLAFACLLGLELGIGRAQSSSPNPLVVPPLPPSPPAQLPAPVSTAVAPSPLAIPSLPAAYATPGPRTFNCTCSGPGTPTHWMGQVTASSYAGAKQSASGACVAYNQGKPPPYGSAGGIGAGNSFGPLPGAAQNVGAANFFPFPGVAQSSGAANSLGGLPGATQAAGQANSFGAPPNVLSFSSAQQQRLCSECVCN
jgi:hypothetical protein